MSVRGQVVFLTGASGFIGQNIAQRLLQEGASVFVHAHAHADRLAALLQAGARGPYRADLRDPAQTDVACAAFLKDAGRVDALVHCAGHIQPARIEKMTDDEWQGVLSAHLDSAFRLAKRLGREMLRAKSGHMIFIGSYVGEHGEFGQANYAAAKAGLIGLARSIAKELGKAGVRANCVLPGFIEEGGMGVGAPDRTKEYNRQKSTLGRLGSVAATVEVVAALLSPTMATVSGQVFHADSRV